MVTAAGIALAAAACTGGGKTKSGPAEVHDDVYVTGGGNNRILVQGDTAYVVNSFDNTVDKVDLATCTAAAHSCQRTGQVVLPTGSNPYDVILLSGYLYVSGLLDDHVYKVDPSTMTVAAMIGSNGSMRFSTPQSFGTDGASLLVSNANGFGSGPGYVSVVTSSIVGEIATSELFPIGFTRLPDNSNAVIDGGLIDFSGPSPVVTSAAAIDFLTPGGIVRSIPLGLEAPGPQLALSEDHTALFVGKGLSASVMKIAEDGSGSPQTLTLGSNASASFISHVVVDGGTVWALSYLEDRVYAIDAATFTVKPVHLPSGDLPYIPVGPGGGFGTAKGPVHAALWQHGGRTHLLVLLSAANSMTDILLP